MGQGYEILDRNVYTPHGEVDLIVETGERLLFVEVKYRTSLQYGTPREAINGKKLNHMKKTMLYLIKERSLKKPCDLAFLGILEQKNADIDYDFIQEF